MKKHLKVDMRLVMMKVLKNEKKKEKDALRNHKHRIYNPLTKEYYPIKQVTWSGNIRGLWSGKKKKKWWW